jgi:spore maturation protein CgeB
MLSKFYEIGTEIICYKDEQDLKKLIQYYLRHSEEREQIAKNGQKKAQRLHTYKKRLEYIISIIKEEG